jgi:hypothetical protein
VGPPMGPHVQKTTRDLAAIGGSTPQHNLFGSCGGLACQVSIVFFFVFAYIQAIVLNSE